jgi:hypothetical protein
MGTHLKQILQKVEMHKENSSFRVAASVILLQ